MARRKGAKKHDIPIAGRLDPERIGGHDGSDSGEQSITQNCSCEAGQPHFQNKPAATPRSGVGSSVSQVAFEVEVTRRGGD